MKRPEGGLSLILGILCAKTSTGVYSVVILRCKIRWFNVLTISPQAVTAFFLILFIVLHRGDCFIDSLCKGHRIIGSFLHSKGGGGDEGKPLNKIYTFSLE